jgi:dTDP-glucose 4,6-dehydratase
MLVRITGKEAEVVSENERLRPEKSEVDRLVCNASLAKDLAGWQPEYTLEECLEITAVWVREYLHIFQVNEYIV